MTAAQLDNLTAPRIALDLAERAELVAQFGLYDPQVIADWTVDDDPELPTGVMVIRWHRATVTVGELGDLTLAQRVAVERAAGLSYVRLLAAEARHALGWSGRSPVVRCVVCRVLTVAAEQHAPGSAECRDTQTERRLDHSD